ncbi:MAG TPA: alpha/beta fold hydrolase [Verrucomicrobiae bacterium]|jgi:pimeloyl-ACP methyl ester carboxylesterase|nr:alpha/beta fold hydrolase [Verrucomicrobiae bacterium]
MIKRLRSLQKIAAGIFVFAAAGCASQSYLKTSDGVSLAYEYQPVPSPKGTALLVHGLGTNLSEWYNFKKFLNDNGWSTMALDLRGHGMSTSWNGEELDWRNFTGEGRLSTLRDLAAAVDFLHRPDNLWLVGSSFGASLSVLHAAEDPAVRGLVLFTPGIRMGPVPTDQAVTKLTQARILIAAAEDDAGAVENAKQLYEKTPGSKKLLTYPKGGHGSEMLDNVKGLKEEVLKWMNQEEMPKA